MPACFRYLPLAALAFLAACATAEIQDTEQMLAASGFAYEAPDTPERIQQLQSLPPHTLMMKAPAASGEAPTYVYADPDLCRCLYVGNAQNYQYFQQLAVQRRIADEQLRAAQLNASAALGWSLPAPVVIVHEHDHH